MPIDLTALPLRLEIGKLDRMGHVSGAPGVSWLAPLDGPPTIECGAFVEAPLRRLGVAETWEVAEGGRPPRTWHVEGIEAVNGVRAIKVVGQQQSLHFPRALRIHAFAHQERRRVLM